MTDITRNTFDESKGYLQVAFQRNRDVLDSELNELQDNLRVDAYRSRYFFERVVSGAGVDSGPRFVISASAAGKGKDFSPISWAGNVLTLQAGEAEVLGYRVAADANVAIANVTAPAQGVARTDYVWVALQETWVDSSADPNIAVGELGETTQRRKLLVTFGVSQGSPPVSTGEPWLGLVKYVVFGKLFWSNAGSRSEEATLASWSDLRQTTGNLARGSAANLFMRASRMELSADGATFKVVGLAIIDPHRGYLVADVSEASVSVSADKVVGWSGDGASRLRRLSSHAVTVYDVGLAETGVTSPFVVQSVGAASPPNDSTFWLLRTDSAGIVLRDGTRMFPGDILCNWQQGGEQVSCVSQSTFSLVDGSPYMKKYREAGSNNVVSTVDYLGFMNSGFVFEFQELFWGYSVTTILSTVSPQPSWSPWTVYQPGNTAQIGMGVRTSPPNHFPVISCLELYSGGVESGVATVVQNKLTTNTAPLLATDECLIVGEWVIGTAAGPSAGKKASFSFGFADLSTDYTLHPSSGVVGGLPVDKNYWLFFCDQNGVWYGVCQKYDGTNSHTELTGFSLTDGAVYRFRMELVGVAYGGLANARFWINDKLYAVGTPGPHGMPNEVNGTTRVGAVFSVGCSATASGPCSLFVGPTKIRWKAALQLH